MTKTFERFLRSLSDEDLAEFAQQRSRIRPPYWNLMYTTVRIEAGRRGLRLADDLTGPDVSGTVEAPSTS